MCLGGVFDSVRSYRQWAQKRSRSRSRSRRKQVKMVIRSDLDVEVHGRCSAPVPKYADFDVGRWPLDTSANVVVSVIVFAAREHYRLRV